MAVSLVVLAHAELGWFNGGFIGVDVFFVLSGYLISALLVRELDRRGKISFLGFYARRIKRLLPALLFMIGVVGVAGFWLLSAFEASHQLASASFAAVWVSNFYFAFTGFDYFDELAQKDLFLHTWSLGVEEQFYLIWPLLLLLVFRCCQSRVRGKSLLPPFLVLSIVGLASFILSLYLTFREPKAAFFLMPSRIWQFSLGAFVYLAFDRASEGAASVDSFSLYKPLGWLLLVAGLILILGSAATLHPNLPYPGYWAIFPSLGAALVILAGLGLSHGQQGVLAQPAMVWLGDRSYSLYLWHWPVLVLGFSLGFKGQLWPTVGLVLFSLILTIFSYRIIELPFWKGRLSRGGNRLIILVGFAASLFTVALAMQMQRWLPDPTPAEDLSGEWRADLPPIYARGCDASYRHARIEPCEFGSSQAEKTLLLIGDSIGAQWFSMLTSIFSEPEWRTIVLTKSSCAIVDEEIFYGRLGKTFEICEKWRNDLLDDLDAFSPDLIVVGSAATYDFTNEEWAEGSARVFDRMIESTQRVVVIPGTPSLGFDGPSCLVRQMNRSAASGLLPSRCSSNDRMQLVSRVSTQLFAAANQYRNVDVIDLNDLVCPNSICSAGEPEGIVIFRDSQHLTDTFVQSLAPEVADRFEQLGIFP